MNYRGQRSERSVGAAIRRAISAGAVSRDELVVCSKGGYIPLNAKPPASRDEYREYVRREFVETQEEAGMTVIGTFCDADNPDRFVWLREFPDMASRSRSLAAFYGGPVWKAHREAANATMLDSDNVLLLRPAWSGSDFAKEGTRASRIS